MIDGGITLGKEVDNKGEKKFIYKKKRRIKGWKE